MKRSEYIACLFVGRKGSGKTQLAKRFCWNYKNKTTDFLTISVDPNYDEYEADYYYTKPSQVLEIIESIDESVALFIDEIAAYRSERKVNRIEYDAITALIYKHRHNCCDIFCSTQTLISVEPSLRRQFDFIYMLDVSYNEQQYLKDHYCITAKSDLKLFDRFADINRQSNFNHSRYVLRLSLKLNPKIEILKL